MLKAYEQMFGGPPSKRYSCLMDKDDHPELDNTSLLSEEDIKIYQSMIGALQWAITLQLYLCLDSVLHLEKVI